MDNNGNSTLLDTMVSESDFVGGIYDMNHETAVVETDDHIKRRFCGGLPRNSLVIARMRTAMEGDDDEDEDTPEPQLRDHVLLLRVRGPADLPIENELRSARFQNIGERIVSELNGAENAHELDSYTQRELQQTAVETDVLGTFYVRDGDLEFGSDVHTAFSSAEYLVYKPDGDLLANIVNDYAVRDVDEEDTLKIGHVRYASSRLQEESVEAPVRIDTSDLIGLKTAVLGMTRTGKSNTLKVVAAATHVQQDDVGQLIFDPSGEYSNPNQQGTALVELDDYETDSDIETFEYGGDNDLVSNLLAPANIEMAKSKAEASIRTRGTNANYIQTFLDLDLVNPNRIDYDDTADGYRQKARDQRKMSAFHAVMSRAGLEDPDYTITFPMGEDVRNFIDGEDDIPFEFDDDAPRPNDEANAHIHYHGTQVGNVYDRGNVWFHNLEAAEYLWRNIYEYQDEINAAYDRGEWVDDELGVILRLLAAPNQETGYGYLTTMTEFHNPDSDEASAPTIYRHLRAGNTVIVDMSNGSEDVVSHELESIIQWILNESERRFSNGEDLEDIQIFLEEAHRYFKEDRFSDDSDDTYVQLAKEGAKFELGLVYATQEVTTVDDRVLANTANWVVTHLNSGSETRALGDYYDFEAFSHLINRVDEKGYACIRMDSDRFTLPVQIDEFTDDWLESIVNEANESEDAGTFDLTGTESDTTENPFRTENR